jgi:hypothetical protein
MKLQDADHQEGNEHCAAPPTTPARLFASAPWTFFSNCVSGGAITRAALNGGLSGRLPGELPGSIEDRDQTLTGSSFFLFQTGRNLTTSFPGLHLSNFTKQ